MPKTTELNLNDCKAWAEKELLRGLGPRPEDPDACWEWQKGVNNKGYGLITWGRRGGRLSSKLAHRVAYAVYNGPVRKNECVCHRCDNPLCCNPDHLWAGAHADNMRDMREKGRDNSGNRKLSDEDVAYIREHTEIPGTQIARDFNVTATHVYMIRWGKARPVKKPKK